MPTGKNSTACHRGLRVSGTRIAANANAATTAALTHPFWRLHHRATGSATASRAFRARSLDISGASLPEAFAEQAGRPEHQHQHEHGEGEDVLPLRAQDRRAPVLQQAEQEAA